MGGHRGTNKIRAAVRVPVGMTTSSLLARTLLLPAVLALLFQTASVAPKRARTWETDSEEDGAPPPRKKTRLSQEPRCERYASCAPGVDHTHQCFCDRLCRVYSDCCSDQRSKQPLADLGFCLEGSGLLWEPERSERALRGSGLTGE